MNRKCLLGLLLCGVMLSGCAGPARNADAYSGPGQAASRPVTGKPAPKLDTIRIALDPADPLNPYTLTSRMNQDIVPLLYDPLVKLDPSFQPQDYLAGEVALAGTQCTVRLREDVLFSSGSPLTAQDAAYSLGLCIARDPAGRYRNITGYQAVDDHTLLITLERPDVYFKNLLTFPVIEQDTAGWEIPPGTGRYKAQGHTRLTANDAHFEAPATIKTIELTDLNTSKEVGYQLITDQLDLALLDPDSNMMETARSVPVQTNQMVYLGFNGALFPTDTPAFRQAVALLVDRQALVQEPYGGRAVPAARPVNPLFSPHEIPGPDPEAAAALLDGMGLDERSAEGWRTIRGNEFEFQLAINVESSCKRETAALLKSALEQCGIKTAVNEYTYEQYKAQVAAGGYSAYLGEIRLSEDMDLTPLLAEEGSAHFLLGDTTPLYTACLEGRQDGAQENFYSMFQEQLPFIPLLFPQAILSHSRNFYPAAVATGQDIFYNIHKW